MRWWRWSGPSRNRGRRTGHRDRSSRRRFQQRGRLRGIKRGHRYAVAVMHSPHPYRQISAITHPEPASEWIERTLADPYTATIDETHPGRVVYYSFIPEAETGKWLVVVVQYDRLFNAYFNRDLLKLWGIPE